MKKAADYTTTRLAQKWDCKTDVVRDLIHNGQLRAFDISRTRGGKPRWRIPVDAVVDFEAARSVRPAVKQRLRRKKQAEVVEFF